MKRKALLVPILLIFFYSMSLAASISENIEFFRNKMAEIKGQIPVQISSTENPPMKCGTPVTVAIHNAIRSDPEYGVLASTLQRPTLPDTFGTTHFLVHYTITGPDAAFQPNNDSIQGVPRYVSRVAGIFEHVWNIEIDSLGYNQPPSDLGFGGGDSRYDVYLVNLGFGTFGYTTPESIPDYGQQAASYIVLENDYGESPNHRYNPNYGGDPILAVKVTAAHEFFHAIQFSYDQFEFDFDNPSNPQTYKPWWMEASAVWMEDVVYTDINDYIGYLPYFYNYIYMSLGTFSYGGDPRAFHPYASVVWPRFMTDKYNNLDIVKQIWEGCAQQEGYNTLPATNAVLGQYGATLQSAFLEFEIWNFHTGNPDSGGFADTVNFYREGNLFNYANGKPIVAETTAYIGNLQSQASFSISNLPNPPEDLAASMIIIKSQFVSGGVDVNFNGQDINPNVAGWHVALLGFRLPDSRWKDIQVDPSTGVGSDFWPCWDSYSAVVLIPTVSGTVANYSTYTYDGSENYNSTRTNCSEANANDPYPSPFIVDGSEQLIIPLDGHSKIYIYNLLGEKVKQIPVESSAFTSKKWNGTNDNGDFVASGIYVILLEGGNKSIAKKIAVINNR